MPSPPLTLDAALRDIAAPEPTVRGQAVRHLAAALLAELGDPPPRLHLAAAHPRGSAVVAALSAALDDPAVAVRAIAATGLGQLGEPDVLARIDPWLADPDPGADPGYLRECAAITCVLLGLAAAGPAGQAPHDLSDALDAPGRSAGPHEHVPDNMSDPPHATGPQGHVHDDLSRRTHEAALARLAAALRAPAPDLRFQAAGGLVELLGRGAEPALCAALDGEADPRVRAALVAALADLDPPGPDACARLAAVLADPAAPADLTFSAALGLAAARDPRAGPTLVSALARADARGRALEALAVLGPAAPAEAVPAAQRIARGWLTPAATRVRAAYALARMAPGTGLPLLAALARSRRAAVREAVADARAALDALARADASRPAPGPA